MVNSGGENPDEGTFQNILKGGEHEKILISFSCNANRLDIHLARSVIRRPGT